ncbi:hypothetical protein HDU98_010023 [Podochytrium sp. JEL0797]|nr:hypothetical protein HDU98_010023 [Podochytrium sp. JEL0797]
MAPHKIVSMDLRSTLDAKTMKSQIADYTSTTHERYDTGRFLNVPRSHFDLVQPLPKGFNATSALEIAVHDQKYFIECELDGKRDLRFGPKEFCQPTTRSLEAVHESLPALLKSWAAFSERNQIVWWISHGEMIGWFWNARLLPWDFDLDIQMSVFQLTQLLQFNQTMIDDRFLIDVGPNVLVRTPQFDNTIDARVVDTKTGYFMDITGLAQISSSSVDEVRCKSPHAYGYADIMPLRETVLEGVKVWRPREVSKILKQEYGLKALYSPIFYAKGQGLYKWSRASQLWLKMWSK